MIDFEVLKNQNYLIPGVEAHRLFIPDNRIQAIEARNQANKTFRNAAVSILISEQKGEQFLTLIKRSTYNGNHSAQIAFPGGKMEPTDVNLLHTSIRETKEEIGIEISENDLIFPLTEVFIPVSNFVVSPFLFYKKEHFDFIPQEREVEQIIQMPFHHVLDVNNIKIIPKLKQQSYVLKNVPSFIYDDHIIWGATALMINELRLLVLNHLNLNR